MKGTKTMLSTNAWSNYHSHPIGCVLGLLRRVGDPQVEGHHCKERGRYVWVWVSVFKNVYVWINEWMNEWVGEKGDEYEFKYRILICMS